MGFRKTEPKDTNARNVVRLNKGITSIRHMILIYTIRLYCLQKRESASEDWDVVWVYTRINTLIGTSINKKYRIFGNAANQVLRSESDDDANI